MASCQVKGLPAGLTLANDCSITGTPTTAQIQSLCYVLATNTAGRSIEKVLITINNALVAPSIANATAISGTTGTAITSTSFTNSGGAIASCSVAPALPTGLTLANDCTISGTPTAAQTATTHTVTATNTNRN
ncbi:MAG: putative Ig domain-containing protein [Sulfurimonas sp.]|nr:putative Ig domain-containing protein [Sulfurimonas sp.]